MASEKILAPEQQHEQHQSNLHPDQSEASYMPSPISPNSTGIQDGPVSRGTSPTPASVPPTTAPSTAPNGHSEVHPAPPTYDAAIHERYGESEKPNAPQPGPAPTMVTPLTAIGRTETTVDCPRCQQAVKTRIERHVGQRATIWSVVICLCVGCLCAWIPCVMDDCKDVEHYCSQCNLALATVSAGGAVELGEAARKAQQTASQHPGQQGQEARDGQQGQYAPNPQMQQQHQAQQGQQTGHVDANGRPVAELS
ncbi:hypothetical protein KVT40_008794 [Elsinoe batatas]|uniref:LITAF domain-containing protein n=1 Tax=Elsinoe batatas TaxID=2601811 RepID=A0A8K0PE54_9PEZI|nr:hypothetical protein KVT40_008794 [Elsinoe batatas]